MMPNEHPVEYCMRMLKRIEVIDGILVVMGLDRFNYIRYKDGLLKLIDEYSDIVEKLRKVKLLNPELIGDVDGLDGYLVHADCFALLTRRLIEEAVRIYEFGGEECGNL